MTHTGNASSSIRTGSSGRCALMTPGGNVSTSAVHWNGALFLMAAGDDTWKSKILFCFGDLFLLGGNSPATQKLPPIRPSGYSVIIFGNEPEQA